MKNFMRIQKSTQNILFCKFYIILVKFLFLLKILLFNYLILFYLKYWFFILKVCGYFGFVFYFISRQGVCF